MTKMDDDNVVQLYFIHYNTTVYYNKKLTAIADFLNG